GALCIFYLLLLSLSERAGFTPAYLAAAAATTLQIALYARALLGNARRAAVLGAILTALYSGLFLLIGLEETALLVGSVALFVLLTIGMWLTRGVGRGRSGAAESVANSPQPGS
ncbi:inner membrane CreD family protein, partial [Amaricoccus sp.]|uniref:inner membrane CreD family protein n=1 Tax=Amaricoccus sp. TaxID=1872485 RepID=UPI001B44BA9A